MGLAALLMAPLLAGQAPTSHDHPVHLYNAWTLWQKLAYSGRLSGWDHGWFFGYPAGDLYPVGSALWVAAFRAVSFGQLSWEQTYALAFAGFFGLAAASVYTLGRRLVGQRAGAIASVLWMLDPGDFREGGWWYTQVYGVWPQTLGLAFALFGLAALDEGLESRRPRDLARAGLAIGLGLLGHPTTLIVLGTGLPLYLAARWMRERRAGAEGLLWIAAACALGFGVAAFWQLPMLARSAWTNNIGELWMTLPELGGVLLKHGAPWWNGWPVLTLCFCVGVGWAVRKRNLAVLFLAAWALLLLVGATSTPYTLLRLDRISSAFAKIQYERLVIPAKIGWFVVSAYALDQLGGAVAARWRRAQEERALPSPSHLLAILAVLALCVWVGKEAVHWTQKLTAERYMELAGSGERWEESRAFVAWAREKRAESEDFYRIALDLGMHNHRLMSSPIETGTPVYKVGYTPVNLFRGVVSELRADLLSALSVRYVVRWADLNTPLLIPETTLGTLRIFRYADYTPRRSHLEGPGSVEAEDVGTRAIRLRLAGTAAGSHVVLHVAAYDRWEAQMNGEPVSIEQASPGPAIEPMLMDIPVSDGDLVVRWVDRPVDRMAAVLSLLTLGLVGVLVVAERRISTFALRFSPQLGRLARAFAVTVAVLALVVLLTAFWRWGYGSPAVDAPSPWMEGGREPPRGGS